MEIIDIIMLSLLCIASAGALFLIVCLLRLLFTKNLEKYFDITVYEQKQFAENNNSQKQPNQQYFVNLNEIAFRESNFLQL